MKQSKKYSVNWLDVVKGAIVATLTSGLTALQTAIDSGSIAWKPVGMAALAGFVGYLIKNFFTAPPLK